MAFQTRDDPGTDRGRYQTSVASLPASASDSHSCASSRSDSQGTYSRASQSSDTSRRNRLSFFGRSNSSASQSSIHTRKATTTYGDQSAVKVTQDVQSRSRHGSTGRKTSSSTLESLRNIPFFTGRKSVALSSTTQPSPRLDKTGRLRDNMSTDHLRADGSMTSSFRSRRSLGTDKEKLNQDHKHRTKSSISSPFNFQHVTHTAKQRLPKLDTVDEKDLTRHFWAASAYQQAGSQSHGIPTNVPMRNPTNGSSTAIQLSKVDESEDEMSSPVSYLATDRDEGTRLDEALEGNSNSSLAHQAWVREEAPVYNLMRSSSRSYSTMNAASSLSPKSGVLPSVDGSCLHNVEMRNSGAPACSATRVSLPTEWAPVQARIPVHGMLHASVQLPLNDAIHERPLPPIPYALQTAQGCVPNDARLSYFSLPDVPKAKVGSVTPVKSKRSSRSWATMSSLKSANSRRVDILEEPSWEDAVDFAYAQEAEGRCDFDWESSSLPLIEEDEGIISPVDSEVESPVRGPHLSSWLGQQRFHRSKSSLANVHSTLDTGSVYAELGQHRRGSSVGHRGFAAARNASQEALSQVSPAVPLEVVCEPAGPPPLSISLVGPDVNKTLHPSPALGLTSFDASMEYLSDPESTILNVRTHRKSSSFSSFESSGRSLQTASEKARWSSASTSSIPDLLWSKRVSHTSLVKARLSRPPDLALHSMAMEVPERMPDNLSVPDARITRADSFVMRRPETSGDREILFQAGRSVQRDRSATPHRLQSRVPIKQAQPLGWI